MAVPYSKLMLAQRIRKWLNNGFVSDDFTISNNEIILHIDQAIATRIIGTAYENARIEGVLVVPEAYLVTYQLTALLKDDISGYWYSTLPQPPLSLPLGYSINRVYIADATNGWSYDALPIRAKRVGYRKYMPFPTGFRYWVENEKIWIAANNNTTLLNQQVYVQMPSTRTTDINADMALPDDAIEYVFNSVCQLLIKRSNNMADQIKDNTPAGNDNVRQ